MSPQPPQQPVSTPARRGLSGWSLAAVIFGVVVVVCLLGGLITMVARAGVPEPTAAIVSCEVDNDSALPSAEVQWEITNESRREDSWTVTVSVHDGQGRQVGRVRDGAFNIPAGQTVTDTVRVFLDAPGGENCRISVDD